MLNSLAPPIYLHRVKLIFSRMCIRLTSRFQGKTCLSASLKWDQKLVFWFDETNSEVHSAASQEKSARTVYSLSASHQHAMGVRENS